MMRKKNKSGLLFLSSLFLFVLVIAGAGFSGSQEPEGGIDETSNNEEPVNDLPESYEGNKQCLQCHANEQFSYFNENLGKEIKKLMCPVYVIDSTDYYNQVHKSFYCTDCHAPDFESYPHPAEIKGEMMWQCIDCHGYDEAFAQYNFEAIQEQYYESVHYQLLGDEFSCWKCHEPHSYQNKVRTADDLTEIIAYDNNICLSCHANIDQFKLLSEREAINIVKRHDWLPNQELHFKKVRCLECHTAVSDTVLVSHLIKPSEEAVRNCVECHSKNSLLMSTLYKYESRKSRSKYGFLNGVILNDSYVIGANRNYYLNVISIVIFILTMGGIFVHAALRIATRKKK